MEPLKQPKVRYEDARGKRIKHGDIYNCTAFVPVIPRLLGKILWDPHLRAYMFYPLEGYAIFSVPFEWNGGTVFVASSVFWESKGDVPMQELDTLVQEDWL